MKHQVWAWKTHDCNMNLYPWTISECGRGSDSCTALKAQPATLHWRFYQRKWQKGDFHVRNLEGFNPAAPSRPSFASLSVSQVDSVGACRTSKVLQPLLIWLGLPVEEACCFDYLQPWWGVGWGGGVSSQCWLNRLNFWLSLLLSLFSLILLMQKNELAVSKCKRCCLAVAVEHTNNSTSFLLVFFPNLQCTVA